MDIIYFVFEDPIKENSSSKNVIEGGEIHSRETVV